jgi:hypothetical protein
VSRERPRDSVRRRTSQVAVASALVALAACATQPPSADERAAFGDVAVEVIAAPESIDWDRPVTGWPAGLGMGAVRGVGAVVVFPAYALVRLHDFFGPGAGEAVAVLAVPAVVGGAAAGAVWAPVSVVGGAVTAAAPEEIEAAEPVVRGILEDPGLWATVGAHFGDAVRRHARRDLVPPAQATTIVEVRLVSIERGSAWNWWTFDRPFEATVEVSVRVVRTSDGHVVWSDTRKAVGGSRGGAVTHTYVEWALDEGAPLRAAVDAALRSLAEEFAILIFAAPAQFAPPPRPPAAPKTWYFDS